MLKRGDRIKLTDVVAETMMRGGGLRVAVELASIGRGGGALSSATAAFKLP